MITEIKKITFADITPHSDFWNNPEVMARTQDMLREEVQKRFPERYVSGQDYTSSKPREYKEISKDFVKKMPEDRAKMEAFRDAVINHFSEPRGIEVAFKKGFQHDQRFATENVLVAMMEKGGMMRDIMMEIIEAVPQLAMSRFCSFSSEVASHQMGDIKNEIKFQGTTMVHEIAAAGDVEALRILIGDPARIGDPDSFKKISQKSGYWYGPKTRGEQENFESSETGHNNTPFDTLAKNAGKIMEADPENGVQRIEQCREILISAGFKPGSARVYFQRVTPAPWAGG